MREILNRIKRGELQLFLNLVNAYLSQVYFSARDNYTEEEAIIHAKDIFLKLYDKVLNYIFIFDAQNYIDNNLEKIASKKGISLKGKYLDDDREVPEQVLRQILLEISAKSKTKKKRSILITVPIITIIFLIGITFMSQVSSSNDTHPKGTIKRIENQVDKIFEYKYDYSEEKITSFFRLDDYNVLIEELRNNIYSYEIHNIEDGTVLEVEKDKKLQFIKYTNNKELVFKNKNILEKYNSDFELIDKLELETNINIYSENNNFALLKAADKFKMIDLNTFEIKLAEINIDDKIMHFNKNGEVKTRAQLYAEGYEEILDRDYYITDYVNDKLITITDEGVLKVYENGNLLFSTKLAHYQDLEFKQTHDYIPHMRTMLYNNEDYLIIPIRSRSNANFEIYDLESGELITALADTLRSGDHNPMPVISSDGKAFLLATQYKTRRQALRFNAVYDLSTIPIKEYHLTSIGHIEVMEIIGSNDLYYVYTFDDDGYFRVYKVKFVNS